MLTNASAVLTLGILAAGSSSALAQMQIFNPGYSPDGTRILLDVNMGGNWEICSIASGGGEMTRLTDHPGLDLHSCWSPDGQGIVFSSERDGQRDLYLMHHDGTHPEKLTDDAAIDNFPWWSPTRPEIVFQSDRVGYNELYILDLETKESRRLTHAERGASLASWSPDGESVIYSSDDDLYLIGRDGGAPEQLTDTPDLMEWKATIHPDGKLVAYTGIDNQRNLDIYLLNLESRTIERLTDDPKVDRHPSWSPDGKSLAFCSNRDGVVDVLVMDLESRRLTRLTEASGPR